MMPSSGVRSSSERNAWRPLIPGMEIFTTSTSDLRFTVLISPLSTSDSQSVRSPNMNGLPHCHRRSKYKICRASSQHDLDYRPTSVEVRAAGTHDELTDLVPKSKGRLTVDLPVAVCPTTAVYCNEKPRLYSYG